MLTLDEAIRHAQGTADNAAVCSSCREDHRQLAEWLRELKQFKQFARELFGHGQESPPSFLSDYKVVEIPESCRGCPQHPSNGGSGICFCILGQPIIT